MSDRPKYSNPVVRVVMDDGAEFEVQTVNPDLLRWEETAPRHHWGRFDEVPVLWLTFIGWAALKRDGQTTLKWEEFKDRAYDVSSPAVTEVDPTDRGPGEE